MEKSSPLVRISFKLMAGGAVGLVLYVSSRYSYVLFHSVVELFSVLTAFMVFALAWNTRKLHDNHYLLFIGIASLFTGALDVLHALSYKGMGVFPGNDANMATQFWIAFRFVFSTSFLLATFFIRKKLNVPLMFMLYLAVLLMLMAAVLWGWFPDCYIEGQGLTGFKIISEYVICLILLAGLVLLLRHRAQFDPLVLKFMVFALALSIASEVSFTEYAGVYGFANMLGHLFLVASMAFIYRAIVVTGVVDPSTILFRNLKQSEETIRASETKYRLLFKNMTNGFAYHRIVTDEYGVPIDYVFLEVNDAFELMTGLRRSEIIGKSVRSVMPGIEKDSADWIRVYGDVALTGREVRLEQRSEMLGRWYSVAAYSPIHGHFVTVFEDITDRKQAETDLYKQNREIAFANRILEVFVKETGSGMYDKALDVVLEQMESRYGVFGYIDEQGVLVCPTMSRIFDECEMEGKCIQYTRDKWKGLWSRALLERRTLYANTPPVVPKGHVLIQNNMAVPILFHDQVIGLFNLANKASGYREEDREFLEAATRRIAPMMYAWIQKEMRENERKRAEESLRRAHDELEMRVRERTAELAGTNEELEREISVRRLAEKGLRSSEERFRTSVENLLDGFAIFSAVRDAANSIVDFRYEYINEAGCRLNYRSRDEQVGHTMLELLPARRQGKLFKEYVDVVETGEPLSKSQLVIEDTYGGGRNITCAFDMQAVKLGDGFAVVWRDVSERRETERRIALTNELLKLYTQKFSRKEYLEVAVELIRGWSGCRHVGVRIADREGNIPYESCSGYDRDFLASESNLSVKRDQCICVRVAVGEQEPSDLISVTPNGSAYSNETLHLVDQLTAEQRPQYRGVCMRHGFRSLAVVPVRHRDAILGAIHLADERAGMVPLTKVEFVEQLAFIIGEALFRFSVEEDLVRKSEELSGMNEQLRNLSAHMDAVREGERTNIAREIHDELGQVLTAIKMDVSWLGKRLSKSQGTLANKAEETLQIIDAAIQSVKRISLELRPSVLDDIGLAAAIDWAAKDFQKRTGLRCTVTVDSELIVDRMRSTALFRIFQESLTNIMRHARATQVFISLEEKDRTIVLTVSDNGKGIKKEEIFAPHSFGLIGMRERVQFLGGDVQISGVPKRGTTVTVSLPVDSRNEQALHQALRPGTDGGGQAGKALQNESGRQ